MKSKTVTNRLNNRRQKCVFFCAPSGASRLRLEHSPDNGGALPIEKNIIKFFVRSSNIVGNLVGDMFNVNTWTEIQDYQITSPIEQIIYCALRTLRETNFIEKGEPIEHNGKWFSVGLTITPQVVIGKYRCDFEISYGSSINREGIQKTLNKIFVECDSQVFHERTEKERRYEKARDRYIQSKSFKILHYTGKEILENPFQIAAEIISTVTGENLEDLRDSIVNYDNEEE
jgi:very-short-patch-repair endonuclease